MFFGVTQLGAPTPYQIRKYDSCATVSVADFLTSFRKNANQGLLEVNEANITALLHDALQGRDPLAEDVQFFVEMLKEGSVVDQLDFANCLKQFHEVSDLKPTKGYTSFRQLREDKIKHKRPLADPHQCMRAPLTTAQDYGWGGANTTKKALETNLTGNLFCHKPSFLSYYNEFQACAEDGRDFVPGPTMRAVEHSS